MTAKIFFCSIHKNKKEIEDPFILPELDPLWFKLALNMAFRRELFDLSLQTFEQDIDNRFTRMRDRCFDLVKSSNTDFPAWHILSKPGQEDPADGIAVYEVGYCRLLRDEARQIDVDVFSPNIKSLHRLVDAEGKGHLRTIDDDPDLYIIGAYPASLSGKAKREQREARLMEVRKHLMYHEQFYLEATPLNPDDLDGEWGFRVANQSLAFAMRPLEDGRWRIWARPDLNAREGEVDEFVRLPKHMPEGTKFSFLDEGVLDCEDLETAFKRVQQLACKAALNHRVGVPDLVKIEERDPVRKYILTPLAKGIQTAIRKWNQVVDAKYTEGVAIGLGFGAMMTAYDNLTGTGGASTLFSNIGKSILGGISYKFGEETLNQVWQKIKGHGDSSKLNAHRDITEKDYSADYIADGFNNDRRFLKKADPAKVRGLEALGHYQANMAPNTLLDQPENLVYSDDPKLEKTGLLNMMKRVFGAVIARPGMMNMMWIFYPNGATSFRHVEKGEESTKVQALYGFERDHVIACKAPRDHISDLKDGTAKEICYSTGAPNRSEEMRERATHHPVNTTKLEETHITPEELREKFQSAVAHELQEQGLPDLKEAFQRAGLTPFDPVSVLEMLKEMERARRKAVQAGDLSVSVAEKAARTPADENSVLAPET
ncbi:MAG: hypothetical protein H6863_01975 [Rhodospirillales bacterium]|nr:hypothetical protein [Rhodospirillales bacterium]